MNRAAIPAVLVAVLATAGVCYVTFDRAPDARIDGSTEAAFKSSLDTVNMALPAEQRNKFEVAMAAHARAALLPEGDGSNPLAGIMALSADKDAPVAAAAGSPQWSERRAGHQHGAEQRRRGGVAVRWRPD